MMAAGTFLLPRKAKPSFKERFARGRDDADNPEFHDEYAGAWLPILGDSGAGTGSVIPNVAGTEIADAVNTVTTNVRGYQSYDGANDYSEVVDDVNLLRPDHITVAVWFRHTGAPPNHRKVLHKLTGTNNDESWAMGAITANDNFRWHINQWDGAGQFSNASLDEDDTNWHIAIGTYDRVNVQLYFDGVAQTPGAYTAAITVTSFPIQFGRGASGVSFTSCDIRGVHMWHRALSASEASHLTWDFLAPQRLKPRIISLGAAAATDPVGSITQPDLAVLQSSYF